MSTNLNHLSPESEARAWERVAAIYNEGRTAFHIGPAPWNPYQVTGPSGTVYVLNFSLTWAGRFVADAIVHAVRIGEERGEDDMRLAFAYIEASYAELLRENPETPKLPRRMPARKPSRRGKA